uniref:Putative salivary mucin 6 n=1 Tax=Psorophora albipes TaxID=869069 RepID=T1DIX7_9DIPT
MVSSKEIGFGLVICLALVASTNTRRPRGNAEAQAFRKQAQLLALQKYAKDKGIEPPAQNDTNPVATIRQRMQQKALDDYAEKHNLTTTTPASNDTSSEATSSDAAASKNTTPNSSNSTKSSSTGASNPDSSSNNSTLSNSTAASTNSNSTTGNSTNTGGQ